MGFPINPPRTPLVQEDGRTITAEWYRFLLQIQRMIGGPSDPFSDTWLMGTPPLLDGAGGDGQIVAFLNPPPVPAVEPVDWLAPIADPAPALELAAHVAAADPHPGYLTQAEGDARYGALSGALDLNIRTISATATPAADDYTLLVDASGGAVTVNLPAAASSAGRILVVKKIDAVANAVTLDGNGAETIDGAATVATSTQWVAFTIQCNGTAWFVI